MKKYVKPTIEVIDLRTEERLAKCTSKKQYVGQSASNSPGKGKGKGNGHGRGRGGNNCRVVYTQCS